ncbi:MAG TPA: methionyl-tRNA formyltransferase [Candidatus Dojkabacteria bacterium]|jgi:methionyl-tRNA formyltransferase|nr:methionyl-tRNA formyltransferase [Candidatus Dojkabacteria bacterium]HPQ79904.1 methionyl-tRNA formyltransferase [Candidatus Dojkabacteria bacterium]HRZ84771.1 methionyl-tRNA formyltransferase [Candidatus Dojkabacteria bacterium]
MDKVKTIFLGTGWESVETLKTLHKSKEFEVVAVITTPDKPIGRKQIVTPSDVKKYALEKNIPVEQPDKVKERYIEIAQKYNPEIVICKAFGEIVPKEFLDYPKYGCINIHFSLLPKYRGAVPIQKALLDGEKETGITIMLMSEGLDEGDIIDTYTEEIREDDTNISLRERLVKKSTEVLIPVLNKWINGEIVPIAQENSLATYCWQKDISKDKAEIKWEEYEPKYIDRMVRAFIPWPIAWIVLPESNNENLSKKTMKIYKTEITKGKKIIIPGMLWTDGRDVYVSTKEKGISLKLIDFQIEGRKRMGGREFLNGVGRVLLNG